MMPIFRLSVSVFLVLLLLSLPATYGAVNAAAKPQILAQDQTQSTMQSAGQVLNYRDADIRVFIEDIALQTRQTFIIDPGVNGKVNLVSSSPLQGDSLFLAFLSVLKANGLAAIPTGADAYKIVKNADAIVSAAPVTDQAETDYFMTRVFTIQHMDAKSIRDSLKPYVSKTGTIIGRSDMPFLIISDYASNITMLSTLIEKIDVDKSVIRTLRLQHTSAAEMAEVAAEISAIGGATDSVFKRLTVIPVKGSNSLVLKGLPQTLDKYTPLLQEIDANNGARGDVKVVHLKYANAGEMLPMLQSVADAIVKKDAKGNVIGSGNTNGVTIAAYEGSNSIIITAGADMQARITEVIKELDTPSPQVQVEAIIVEVSENATKELGLQYILAGGDSSNIPFTVQNYSQTAPNLLAATGAIVVNDGDSDDSSSAADILQAAAVDSFLGLNGFGLGAAGRTSGGGVFGVILNALSADSDSNILQTPSITTLNNRPASFLAGQEIPITIGESLGSANINTFRQYERKNVGIKLDVVPQINEDGDIQMFITQEVSSIAGTSTNGEIITNKREMSATVRVPNGEVLVLGGLIQENERISVDKVPFLGDLPVLGNAFKSTSKVKEKTNLMVFLRPTILNSSSDIKQATDRKYNLIRARQKASGSTLDLDAMMREITGKKPSQSDIQPQKEN